jgi:hypothetical protein
MRLLGIAVLLSTLLVATPAVAGSDIEDYASYEPSSKCHPKARPGTDYLAHWVVQKYGGGFGGTSRPCDRKATSEHQNGRAFDWSLDATERPDRRRARAFMARIFETDGHGNTDAWARRMGVMYVIWNDTMYPAWSQFEPEPYLSSSCHRLKRCSKTLRHRDHLHVSLSAKGARGVTSWYDGRL